MSEKNDTIDKILAWSREIRTSNAVEWDRLPEIYLYMDQVLTYMNKQLRLYERNENESLLTSSMINNYVKDGVLPRPEQKKYSREHLAILLVICMLKQVLSIQDISSLIRTLLKDASQSEMYNRFCEAQSAALQQGLRPCGKSRPERRSRTDAPGNRTFGRSKRPPHRFGTNSERACSGRKKA
jgi:DNA-binding transcriptional MerR regulator